jgi:type I restriction enzyme, S subunit
MKAYQVYKTTNLEWLRQIPEHWASVNLRWVSQIFAGGTPSKEKLEYWESGTIPWIASGEVNQGYITSPTTYITEEGFNNSSAKWIPKDALVMALAGQGKTKATVARLGIATTCNQSLAAIVPLRISARYLFYWLQSNYQRIRGLVGDGLRDGLNLEIIGSLPSLLPPHDEQQAIADFLDCKTIQIDTLIEKKRRQIDLLQEQRTALINHAVTEGLNSDAPMKDSGVEWLGEIPSRWIVSKLKYLCYVSDGNHGEEYPEETDFTDEENGVPFIRVTEFDGFNITRNGILYITKEKNESMRKGGLQENDILFVNRGSIGKIALVSKEFEGANLNSQIAYFRVTSPKMNYKFLLYFLSSGAFQKMLSSLIHGGALQQLPLKRIIGLEVLCPPIEDQIDIVNYLEQIATKADLSIKSISREIELVQEYRTALISEAVTGKIDVREWRKTIHE